MKEYKTQIAIIIGALIIAFALYYSMTAEFRNKVKACVKDLEGNSMTLSERKEDCTKSILQYGSWR